MCHGERCTPAFIDVKFERCTLVVLAGAQATLERPSFTGMHACKTGLSIYVEGPKTQALVHGGSITGGLQVATVQVWRPPNPTYHDLLTPMLFTQLHSN